MRATTIICISLVAGLLLCGCPGRNTTPPETPDETPTASSVRRMAGLARFTGEMLRRGAGERSAEQIAEEIEFVGGSLSVDTSADYTVLQVRVLREHLDLAVGLLADLARRPTFAVEEIETIRRRELDRLSLSRSQPRWLGSQAFYRELYGAEHPYGYNDAEPTVIQGLTRDDLTNFHQQHFVPRNSFILAVGDVGTTDVREVVERHFGDWTDRPAPERAIAEPAASDGRRVVVVDRPGTTQAQILVGNLALDRSSAEYVRLRVASQVLGGNASARLFMNLRERCSYSYGVYSSVYTRRATAPHIVAGAVEVQHTAGALREIFDEIERVRTEPTPAAELDAAQAYMVGHFPIITETAGSIAELVTIQRVFELPENYWGTYRSAISAVTADEALAAARTFVHGDRNLVVIVGDASLVAEPARRYGPVTVLDQEGNVIARHEAAPGEWPGGQPDSCPETPADDEEGRSSEPPAGAEARDMDFPEVNEDRLDNGLEVLSVERRALPLVYIRLVIRSGSAADPAL